MKVLIERCQFEDLQTLGFLYVLSDDNHVEYMCHTLELAWKDNKQNVSCIPKGKYDVKKRSSKRFSKHFHVQDVENRKYILIHAGNFYSDIRGCVLVGKDFVDINSDGLLDVVNSRKAMKELLEILPNEFKLSIIENING